MTPVFVVSYFLAIPAGDWLAVVIAQAIMTLAISLAVVGYFRVAIWVSPSSITERGFFGKLIVVNRDVISFIVLADAFERSSGETRPQLFVCDSNEKQLLRMRGQFWSRKNMDYVIATLDVPVHRLDDGISTSDIRAENPGLLYWFEQHPVRFIGIFTLATAIVSMVIFAITETVVLGL